MSHGPPTVGTDQPRRQTSSQLHSGWVALAVFLLVLVALVGLSWDDISQPRFEDGDFAANSILIDQAVSFDLNHGNYSRALFYHPGPALLYVQAWSQVLLFDGLELVPTPYNAHLFGILVLNATMIALAAGILHRRTASIWLVASVIVIAFAYALVFANPGLGGLLSSTWMPHVYVWPFLLLLVSSASVASGHGEDLWKLALAGGLLIHGHVSFVLPVAVFFMAATLMWIRSHRTESWSAIARSSLIATAVVLVALLIPLIAQLVVDFPGQFDDYLRHLRETTIPPRSLQDVARFVAHYWGVGGLAAVLVPLLFLGGFALALDSQPVSKQRFLTGLMMGCVVATATTALYAYTGVDDLTLTYLALFYISVPVLVWSVIGAGIMDRFFNGQRIVGVVVAVTLVVSWVFLLAQPLSGSVYKGSEVGAAYDAIDDLLEPGDRIALSFPHGDWPAAVGLLQQVRRDGEPICARVDSDVFRILFTEAVTCESDEPVSVELLVASSSESPPPLASLVYAGDSFDVWRLGD